MHAGSIEAARILGSVDPRTPDGCDDPASPFVGAAALNGPVCLRCGPGEAGIGARRLFIGRPRVPR
jgi:hypothetical protein